MADDFNQRVIEQFRANDGLVDGFGRSLVLVHHRGARTGTERIAPLMSFATDDGWLIVASKAGADEHPGWYHNLLAHPEVTIEVPGEGEIEVSATELPRDERDAAWARITATASGFADYERRTERVIPVVKLTRR